MTWLRGLLDALTRLHLIHISQICLQINVLLADYICLLYYDIREQGVVAESVEHWCCVWGRSWVRTHRRVKPMTYEIDICRFPARRLALLGYGKEWLAHCLDNVPEWDIRSWC